MYNPLLGDPSKIKDNELELKIQELAKKYHIASRMGYNQICEQLVIALNLYKEEVQRRHRESTEKIIKKQDRDLDDLINVE